MFAAYAAWSAREIELQALALLVALDQISTPSDRSFLKSHQIFSANLCGGSKSAKRPYNRFGLLCLLSNHPPGRGLVHVGVGSEAQPRQLASQAVPHIREGEVYALATFATR